MHTLQYCYPITLQEVLFAIMVAANQLVTLVKPKECSLHPVDIHLIMNLIDASTSFRSAESWTPICLPKFSEKYVLQSSSCFYRNKYKVFIKCNETSLIQHLDNPEYLYNVTILTVASTSYFL